MRVYGGLLLLALAALPAAAADDGLRQAIEKHVYRFEASGRGTYRGEVLRQQLSVELDSHSVRLQHAHSSAAFRLTGYGYGDHPRVPAEAQPVCDNNRLEYRRADLTEWYVNSPAGLEQGFTLAERPGAARPGEPLVISLAVEGDLRPVLAPGDDAVRLQADGRTILRYAGLRSRDARGREIASRLEVRESEIRLLIEDQDAAYPLVVDPTWTLEAELTAMDQMVGDLFGMSVSLSGVAMPGDTVLIGAPGHNSFQGAAYVFVRSGTTWMFQQELTAPGGMAGDEFGFSVSLSGTTALIGAPMQNLGQGAAYVFVRTGTTWNFQQMLTAADGTSVDEFGSSVAVDADTAVIGAPFQNLSQGAAYVFLRTGTTWNPQQKLTASGGMAGDQFGQSVAVSGDTAVIGAPQVTEPLPGEAFVFVRSAGTWTPQQTLTPGDGAPGDEFGTSVAVKGNTLLIGSPFHALGAGTVYVYVRATSWSLQQELVASDGFIKDHFGNSVSVDVTEDVATVGAPNKNGAQGEAYVFVRTGGAWGEQAMLLDPDGGPGSQFGTSVSISGNRVAVGAIGPSPASPTPRVAAPAPRGGPPIPAVSATYIFVGPALAAPALMKSFMPSSILVGTNSTLTFNLSNSSAAILNGVAFTDTLPAGVVVAIPNNLTNTCGGTFSAAGSTISLTGVTLAATSMCTLSVIVTGTTPGSFLNTTSTVTSTDGGTGMPATATLIVFGLPVIAKVFGAASIPVNGTTSLTFTVSNPAGNPIPLTSVGFTDTLPAGLLVANPANLSSTCGGLATAAPGSGMVMLSGVTLASGASCTVSLNVTGTTPGGLINSVTVVSDQGTGNTSTAPIAIMPQDTFQIRYASNLNIGDSFVNITNTGASSGNLCINVYTFDPGEELLACCTCFVTPNGLASLSVKQSLTSNNLTPEIPNAVVIKLLATAAGASAASCNASTPTFPTLMPGMRAWGTTLHAVPTSPTSYQVSETPFTISTLSQGELNHLTSFCGFIQSNASGFGICKGCNVGGLGATTR